MKNINFYFKTLAIALIIIVVTSCRDESKYPIDFNKVNSSNGAFLRQISVPSETFTFDINNQIFDVANSKFQIVIEEVDGNDGNDLKEVNFYTTFVDQNDQNGTIDKPEVKVKTVPASDFTKDPTTGLPRATITINASEVLTALGIDATDVLGADSFVIRQELVMKDGQMFDESNTGGDVSGGPFYATPFSNTVSVVCPSDLGGDIQYSTEVTSVGDGGDISGCAGGVTGTVQFDDQGNGKYTVSDITFGQYDCAWGDTPAVGVTLNDACGSLYLTGGDQYGLIYSISIISNDGENLVLHWENDYGDGGTTTLTRTGGWPLTLTTD
jgi:hypothetical protein